jgi:GGDEF domain-containing protein
MDEVIVNVFAGPSLSESGRGVWEPLVPHAARAVESADDSLFLIAVEEIARSAGLAGSIPVDSLFQGYGEGCDLVRQELVEATPTEESRSWRRIVELERDALTRLAVGYAAGLTELNLRLEQRAESLSPQDPVTGALRPRQIAERLSLELDRSRRMLLPLGVMEMAVSDAHGAIVAANDAGRFPQAHEAAACLRDNLRSYDSVGLTADGAYLIVLPDVSRRGLAGVAERLRREWVEVVARARPIIALEHLDPVDVTGTQILSDLGDGVVAARDRSPHLVWTDDSGSGRAA